MTGPRLVLAEDDVLLREGLASLLERSGYEVAGRAGDGTQLLMLARETRPDLVVADVRMPPTHTTEGLDAVQRIARGGSVVDPALVKELVAAAGARTRWLRSVTGNARCSP